MLSTTVLFEEKRVERDIFAVNVCNSNECSYRAWNGSDVTRVSVACEMRLDEIR